MNANMEDAEMKSDGTKTPEKMTKSMKKRNKKKQKE